MNSNTVHNIKLVTLCRTYKLYKLKIKTFIYILCCLSYLDAEVILLDLEWDLKDAYLGSTKSL